MPVAAGAGPSWKASDGDARGGPRACRAVAAARPGGLRCDMAGVPSADRIDAASPEAVLIKKPSFQWI
ncbi:hypothetical protein Airi02_025680 [Actinoallomurus iriomotensis]|uniref:Uncharacterized protein n=1 Tax=Actinoallomurus iriomotensis TaxID=478107 RepID=A0A9W6VYT3_9ACTN|nr:hypothetical protein Airi02_025680 [Actinoallomurus iriomotensis]